MYFYIIWKKAYARPWKDYEEQIAPILKAIPEIEAVEISDSKRIYGWGLRIRKNNKQGK
jgi:hypothetical protein